MILSQALHGRTGLPLAAVLFALSLAGCRGHSVPLYPVQGMVVWSDGTPPRELVGGTVSLRPAENVEVKASPNGQIQSDGSFTLRTPGFGEGAPAGEYSAIVMPVKTVSVAAPPPSPVMDPRFENHDTSGLKVIVKPGENQITLEVERAGIHRD
jgi:hypothetical protein